jgi:hypothetical protein
MLRIIYYRQRLSQRSPGHSETLQLLEIRTPGPTKVPLGTLDLPGFTWQRHGENILRIIYYSQILSQRSRDTPKRFNCLKYVFLGPQSYLWASELYTTYYPRGPGICMAKAGRKHVYLSHVPPEKALPANHLPPPPIPCHGYGGLRSV